MPISAPLFGIDVPDGFQDRDDFIAADEESALVAAIAGITFANFEMRGVVAKRRVAFFGGTYDAGKPPSPPIPAVLLPLRARLAEWAGITADAFAMSLINEYSPGAPIGWHRDAPQYGIVAGVSLLSSCRMRLRPYVYVPEGAKAPHRRETTHEITFERRSAYLMTGTSRSGFEHHIPAVDALRYSITFRTLR